MLADNIQLQSVANAKFIPRIPFIGLTPFFPPLKKNNDIDICIPKYNHIANKTTMASDNWSCMQS